ncbi:hypothetical protein ACHAP5_010877 [Fusarium lateritium]
MSPVSLYEYFQYVQLIGIGVTPKGLDELLVNKMRIDDNWRTAQKLLVRSIAIRYRAYTEVQNLITSDATETGLALSQWVLSRPADERLICARIAAWEWLNKCDISLIKTVEQWGTNAISKFTDLSADENVTA